MNIVLSKAQLRLVLFIIILINCLLLAGTGSYFYLFGKPINAAFEALLVQSNLAWENTGAAWYSSMLLLFVAVVSIINFLNEINSQKKSTLSYGWLAFGGIFTLLSLDEVGSLHENVGEIAFFKAIGVGEGLGSNKFYAVIVAVGLFMVFFFWKKFHSNKIALFFVITGTLFYLSNPLQERIEVAQMMAAPDYSTWKRPIYFFILEEGSEIFGTLFFLIAVSLYALSTANKKTNDRTAIYQIQIPISRKKISLYELILIAGLSVAFALTWVDLSSTVERGDNGIPQNWFSAALAFVLFLVSFYAYLNADNKARKDFSFLLLAILCLFCSFYFGSDLFERVLQKSFKARMIPTLGLSLFVVVTSILLIAKAGIKNITVAVALWAVLLITAINTSFYSPQLCFTGFSILFYFLSLNLHQKSLATEVATTKISATA